MARVTEGEKGSRRRLGEVEHGAFVRQYCLQIYGTLFGLGEGTDSGGELAKLIEQRTIEAPRIDYVKSGTRIRTCRCRVRVYLVREQSSLPPFSRAVVEQGLGVPCISVAG